MRYRDTDHRKTVRYVVLKVRPNGWPKMTVWSKNTMVNQSAIFKKVGYLNHHIQHKFLKITCVRIRQWAMFVQVFPELRHWCESAERQLHLIDCDLRWVNRALLILFLSFFYSVKNVRTLNLRNDALCAQWQNIMFVFDDISKKSLSKQTFYTMHFSSVFIVLQFANNYSIYILFSIEKIFNILTFCIKIFLRTL